jgi:Ca2+-transporting ATPase
VFTTIRYRNPLLPFILFISLAVLFLSLYFAPVQRLFGLSALPVATFTVCFISAFAGVMWIEIYKFLKRKSAYRSPDSST